MPKPLIMCLTNTVAAGFTANCLLAVGAKPAMVDEPSEAEELAASADAVLVNLGTLTGFQASAMRRAVRVACKRRVPWVLDPVGVQFLSFRRQLALELVGMKPTVIRGNAAEIAALKELVPGLLSLMTILETGAEDRICEGGGVIEISGGVPLLQAVTATGCALGGLCAVFLARGQGPREACLSASKLMKCAGKMAWRRAKTPGSFAVSLVDSLWELSHD